MATFLFGWDPRSLPALWAVYGYAFLSSVYGSLLGLPGWALKLSPFEHVPSLPGGSVAWSGAGVLLVASAGLVGGGLAGLRRRDVPRT